jgi:N-acyl-D-aspartate/D-glutamate deacylase
MDDLVTRGGMVLDGTGSDAARGDLAVRDGRITAIAPRHGQTGARPGRVLRRGRSGVA